MRAVVQRVSRACGRVDGAVVGAIGAGLLVLLGVAEGDEPETADRLAGKVARLRILARAARFRASLLDVGGAALVVSQFPLLADASRGNRPSLAAAARPEAAEPLYERFSEELHSFGVRVERGVFGARMEFELVNDGPVTLVLEAV